MPDHAQDDLFSHSKYRLLCDSTDSERGNKHSEMTSYRSLEADGDEAEMIMVPGRNQFWKWHDYGCADADASLVVVRVKAEADLQISELIEPISHTIAMGCRFAGVILNNVDGLGEECVMKCRNAVREDLRRLLKDSAEGVPLYEVWESRGIENLRSALMSYPVPARDVSSTLELSINSIFDRDGSVILGGKLRKGQVAVGDTVFLMPGRLPLKIASIRISRGREVERAAAGRVIAVRIEGLSRKQVSTGMALVGNTSVGRETRLVRAEMSFFNNKYSVKVGFAPVVSILACQAHGRITAIEGDKESIETGDTAVVTVAFIKTVFVQPHGENNSSCFSRVVFRHSNSVIAVGVIRAILD